MPTSVWVGFIGFVLAMLLIDLGVFHHRPHAIRIREALAWTVVWIAISLLFNLGVYVCYEYHWLGIGQAVGLPMSGGQAAMKFLAAYILEKSLSLDNLFVIALIFAYFGVSAMYQHRVLFWGILGVLVLRGTMIGIGVELANRFDWVNYIFALLLILSAFKMLRTGEDELQPDKNPLVRLARYLYPVSRDFDGGRFFTRIGQQSAITPLLIVLLVVESTDLVFAFDSIPAVVGTVQDPATGHADLFIVFTSNVLAVLGLRSLYFILASILGKFRHLKVSLFLVLLYIGLKMLVGRYYHIDVVASLIVILGILAVGMLASISEPTPEPEPEPEPQAEPEPEREEGLPPARAAGGQTRASADSRDLAIRAVQVTKFYGRRRGITDFSATIPRGALVGLLGPNGAGKTTAIRILSCHMPPTSGTVRVCGFDAFSQSLAVRQWLGYLPENCPLYPEMRVLEYLRWTAQMKGMRGSEVDRAMFQIIEPCGIDHVRAQAIGTLSKGYRQRVGLAAALIHRPEVLILDEPTIGLDPLQAREFRSLISSLKGIHTVLISSHILSEIDVLCDSVIILNEGCVVASGSPQELRNHVVPRYLVECRIDPSLKVLIPHLVHGMTGVTLDEYEEDGQFARFRLAGDGPDPRLDVFRTFAGAGIELREMKRESVTLEDVFLHYTRTILGTAKKADRLAEVVR
jgi:tellurite resistance protein TerC